MRKTGGIGLPPSVRIGPFDFRVDPWPPAEAAQREALGEIDRIGLVIRIRQDLPPQRQAETLLHEIVHGIWSVGSIDCLVPGEEGFVSAFSTFLMQVMRDNPQLLAWFVATAERPAVA